MRGVHLQPFNQSLHLESLRRWLHRPHVARWWGDPDRAMEHAAQCRPEAHAVIVTEGTAVGYLCWQVPTPAELSEAGLADLPEGLVDVDILIGEPNWLGRGVGTEALVLLLERLREEAACSHAGLGTSVSNGRAVRAFEKAGFHLVREFRDPEWGRCKYLVAEVGRTG